MKERTMVHKNIVEVRGLRLGEGVPKICVPLMGSDVEALCEEVKRLVEAGAQMAEWRVDWFRDWEDAEKVVSALETIREALGQLPLLVTFRTKQEGGNAEISSEQYRDLYKTVLSSGQADLIDLELLFDRPVIRELLSEAKACGVKTVVSNHDFEKTPEEEVLRQRFKDMEGLGADLAKIAVMPRNAVDVANLLKVTAECDEQLTCPLVTMSMGGQGVISRMAGQIFGSTVTFGAVEKTSAPGQLPVKELQAILALIDSVQ